MRIKHLAAPALLCLLLAGCGGGSSAASSPTATASAPASAAVQSASAATTTDTAMTTDGAAADAAGEGAADTPVTPLPVRNPVTLVKKIPHCDLPAGATSGETQPDGSRQGRCDVYRTAEDKKILAGTQVILTTLDHAPTPGDITTQPDDFHQVVVGPDFVVTIIGMSGPGNGAEFGITAKQVQAAIGGTIVKPQD